MGRPGKYLPTYDKDGNAVLMGGNTAVFTAVLIPSWIGIGFGISALFGDLLVSQLYVLISFILSIALALFASRVAGKYEKIEENKEKLKGLAVAASFEEKQIEERRKRAGKPKTTDS